MFLVEEYSESIRRPAAQRRGWGAAAQAGAVRTPGPRNCSGGAQQGDPLRQFGCGLNCFIICRDTEEEAREVPSA